MHVKQNYSNATTEDTETHIRKARISYKQNWIKINGDVAVSIKLLTDVLTLLLETKAALRSTVLKPCFHVKIKR